MSENVIQKGKPLLGMTAPRYQSALVINTGYHVLFEHPKPGPWRRFWYWALLGWTWEDL